MSKEKDIAVYADGEFQQYISRKTMQKMFKLTAENTRNYINTGKARWTRYTFKCDRLIERRKKIEKNKKEKERLCEEFERVAKQVRIALGYDR